MTKSTQKKGSSKNEAKGVEKGFFIRSIVGGTVNYNVVTPVDKIESEWNPDAKLELDVQATDEGNNIYTVVLKIAVNVSIKDAEIFKINLDQRGVFQLQGYNPEEMSKLINIFCPNILFPYARQMISQLTMGSGFPPLNVSPVDFESRYKALSQA